MRRDMSQLQRYIARGSDDVGTSNVCSTNSHKQATVNSFHSGMAAIKFSRG